MDKTELGLPMFLDNISTLFNVQLDISTSSLFICLIPNLNIIQVKIIKLCFIVMVIAFIFIFWVGTHVIREVKRKCCSNSTNSTQINDDVPQYCNPPFIVCKKCVYIQFMLIAYMGIAVVSFNAVHCVDISGESYLYIQASVKCYQIWQYMIICFISIFVVQFSFSLYI